MIVTSFESRNVRWLLYATFGLAMACAAIIFQISSTHAQGQTCIVNRGANLRAGDGTTHNVVGYGRSGDSLQVIGKNGNGTWLNVIDPKDGVAKWIATFLCDTKVAEGVNPNATAPTTAVAAVYTASDALAYPDLVTPNPSRQPVFPDVPYGTRPALMRYESPFEDGDYFEDGDGDIDLPQYYYRSMSAGEIGQAELGTYCQGSERKGCLTILINHFGPTAMFRGARVDNGHTDAGRIFNMDTPDKVTLAAQAILDHKVGRMTLSEDGANCSVIDACIDVEWHVLVIGNGTVQKHWAGLYTR